jgi:hypothetical protein
MDKQSIKDILYTKRPKVSKKILNNMISVSKTELIDDVNRKVW